MTFAVGVDIGGTNLRVCLGDEKGRLKTKLSEKLLAGNRNSPIEQLKRMIKSLGNDLSAIGVGSAGLLDLKKGEISKPVHMPFRNIPMVKSLKEEFDVPVYLVNDCDAGVIGEKIFGLGKNEENLAYLTLSTGIGCGVIVDGKLILGKDGNATEVGHFTVDLEGKLKCSCGRYGHWEAYCSGKNIPNFVKLLTEDDEFVTSEKFFEAAKSKNKLALGIVERIGEINAIGISNINAAYDVSLVAIGGSVALKNRKLILKPILGNLKRYSVNRIPKVAITPLGEDVVLLGALAIALNPSIL